MSVFGKFKSVFKIIVDIIVFGRQQQWWDREEATRGFQKRKRATAKFKKKHGYKPLR